MSEVTAKPLAPQYPSLIIRDVPRSVLSYAANSTGYAAPDGVHYSAPVALNGVLVAVECSTTSVDVAISE